MEQTPERPAAHLTRSERKALRDALDMHPYLLDVLDPTTGDAGSSTEYMDVWLQAGVSKLTNA